MTARAGWARLRIRGRLGVVVVGVVALMTVAAQPAIAAGTPGRGPCVPVIHVCAGEVVAGVDGQIPGLAAAAEGLAKLGSVLAEAGQSLLGAGVSWFTQSLVSAAGAIWDTPGGFLDTATRPRLTVAAFLRPGGAYHTMASFSVVLLVVFIFLGVVQGVTSGEPGQALFRVVRDTPVAVLAILGFPWLVDQMLGLTDGLCAALLPPGQTLRALLNRQVLLGLPGPGMGLAGLLFAMLAFAATVLVFLELVVRTALVRMVVALAPLSFAGVVWAPARPAARKVAELAVAVVLAKPAVYVALKVGLDLVDPTAGGADRAQADWGSLLVGIAAVCIAALAPWVVWRLLPTAEAYVVAQGLSRAPARAAMQALQTAYWVDMIRSRGGRQAQLASGGGGPAGQHASPTDRGLFGGAGTGGVVAAGVPGTASGGGAAGIAGAARSPRAEPGPAPRGGRSGSNSGPFTSDQRRVAGGPGPSGTGAGGAAPRPSDGWARRPRPRGGAGGGAGASP